jgi:threonine/homoserine/homoserine lactone efflux protein
MVLGSVAAFWAVSLIFVLTPGADWAYAVSAGLRERSVLPAVGGMLTGHLIATVLVAAGVAAFVAASPNLMSALTIAGAGYLLWLGVGILRNPPVPNVDSELSTNSRRRQLVSGMGVSVLNPKVFLLFLALLPQFTSVGTGVPVPVQIVVLGLIHIASCAVVYMAIGMGAKRVLAARPGAARVVGRVSGAAMIAIALLLLFEQLAV